MQHGVLPCNPKLQGARRAFHCSNKAALINSIMRGLLKKTNSPEKPSVRSSLTPLEFGCLLFHIVLVDNGYEPYDASTASTAAGGGVLLDFVLFSNAAAAAMAAREAGLSQVVA